MSNVQALRSYLVSLGFTINTAQAAQFNNAIKTASSVVNTNTTNIVANLTKWGVATVGLFEGVGVAALAMADKVAESDQEYRLFGQRMFMDTQHAKSLKIALDALGQPIERIAFDPELHGRFNQLQDLQERLQGQLGGDFTRTMIQLRDAQFEFTKLRVEMLYFRDLLIKDIFQALGGETLTEKLRSWNEYIVTNIPHWAEIAKTYLIPVLKDAWRIFLDFKILGTDIAQLFTNVVGILSGDSTLKGAVDFEKFAKALSKVAYWFTVIVELATQLAGLLAGGAIGGTVGGTLGGAIGGLAGLITGGPVGAVVGGATGAAGGASIGAGVLGTLGFIWDAYRGNKPAKTDDTKASTDADFDSIVKAVAQVESGGRQTDSSGKTIISKAGAVGMMQLMPDTARQLGINPYDEKQNLAGGTEYLKQLMEHFGNVHDALAAYNWGPGNVTNALKQHTAFPSSVEGYANNVMTRAVQIGTINITQPNGTPEQIAQQIHDKIEQHEDKTTAVNLNQFRTAY
jgi:hypothetical protein